MLWYKIHVFIYDLRHFHKSTSQARLEDITDSSYLSLPYFGADEVAQLKATTVHNDTKKLEDVIQETLNERLQRRMKESGNFCLCASSDLAPIFEKALNIKPEDFDCDSDFLALVEQSGLKIGDGQVWPSALKRPAAVQTRDKKPEEERLSLGTANQESME